MNALRDFANYIDRQIERRRCPECGRVFDLSDEEQAEEFFYGHDCEEGGDT